MELQGPHVYLLSVANHASEKKKKSIEKERQKRGNCSMLCEAAPELRHPKGRFIAKWHLPSCPWKQLCLKPAHIQVLRALRITSKSPLRLKNLVTESRGLHWFGPSLLVLRRFCFLSNALFLIGH